MNEENKNTVLQTLSLGQQSEYPSTYDAKLLQAVPRSLNRDELGMTNQASFVGCDVWHAYEMSWLNAKGKPIVCLGRFSFACHTPNIVESKSFKLYLNSFNQTRFNSQQEVLDLLAKDLSNTVGGCLLYTSPSPRDRG